MASILNKHIIQVRDLRTVLEQGYSGTIPAELKKNQIAITDYSGFSGYSGISGTTSGYRISFRAGDGSYHDVANLNDIQGYGASGYTGTITFVE